MRARFQPRPQLERVFNQAILNVNFLRLVAREREVEPREKIIFPPRGELFLVKKICRASLVTKEQPVFPFRAGGLTFFEKSAERCDTRAGSDHDHWGVAINRWTKSV